jgi:3-oxoacyl-[acyl-carrier-protein] synthase-3
MKHLGNLSSASIPFALRAAHDAGAIQPGDRVLLSAFGIGISYGSAIVQF